MNINVKTSCFKSIDNVNILITEISIYILFWDTWVNKKYIYIQLLTTVKLTQMWQFGWKSIFGSYFCPLQALAYTLRSARFKETQRLELFCNPWLGRMVSFNLGLFWNNGLIYASSFLQKYMIFIFFIHYTWVSFYRLTWVLKYFVKYTTQPLCLHDTYFILDEYISRYSIFYSVFIPAYNI